MALIHWPVPSRNLYLDSWRALIDAQKSGLTRSIGVSNFNPQHITRLITETGVTPAVNQVELHPRLPQYDVRRFGQLHNILTQAWSPLGHGQLITNKSVVEVAERIGATPAQVLLAWSLHNGIMPITKTLSTTRLQSNYQAIELELAESEIAVLNALADGYRTGPDPEIYGAQ
jgi:2,5-diketo-D-gluconate reductase A